MFLADLWYFALPSKRLKPGRTVGVTLLGEPLLLGRARDGRAFALAGLCPHRGVPLSHGRFDGGEIECCYHGWRFNTEGRCTTIPSLIDEDGADLSRIHVKRYPCREVQGNLWVYFGKESAALPELPIVPEIGECRPRIFEDMLFACNLDQAAVGLMDPAHRAFVHGSGWWRRAEAMRERACQVEPIELGWRVGRHKTSDGYGLLGREATAEISFRLPGVRVEHVKAGGRVLCHLTALTPVSESETRVNHAVYWTAPGLSALKPAIRASVRRMLREDRRILELQQVGLKHGPELMLIGDADVQAKWYYALKDGYAAARELGQSFRNPLKERSLAWRG